MTMPDRDVSMRARPRIVTRTVAAPISTVCLLAAAAALAGDVQYLRKNERICDASGAFCARGTLSYTVNTRLFELAARVEKAPGPGRLRIALSGENRLGHRRPAAIEVALDGRYSEIVSRRMIPDAPDVDSWRVDSIRYVPHP